MPRDGLRLTSTVRLTSAGELSCTNALNDLAPEPTPCPESFDAAAIATMRAQGPESRFALVISMTPEGEPERPVPMDLGTLKFSLEAAIDVAADGSLIECRALEARGAGPADPAPPTLTPCMHFQLGQKAFEPLASETGPRTMIYRYRGYGIP